MTKHEASLLVFLETCLVDYGGTIEGIRMNAEDFETFEKWKALGFIRGGRINSRELPRHTRKVTHWVEFTTEAWEAAHHERRERAARMLKRVQPGGDLFVARNGA